jgi:hypothetical protein
VVSETQFKNRPEVHSAVVEWNSEVKADVSKAASGAVAYAVWRMSRSTFSALDL